MGLFGDAFDIGAGATLGNLAVKTGYQATEDFLNKTEHVAYNKLRSERFDPVVRQDLNDIIVRGMLQTRNYPFPQDDATKKKNFFIRHKIFWIIFLIYTVYILVNVSIIGLGGYVYTSITNTTLYFMAFMVLYAAYAFAKKTKRGAKKLMQSGFRPKLIKDGKQYWHMREYVRQALASKQMSVQDAIVKISNTELGRQFPDTVDEIEANAFYYRQKLGL